jgi:hypothetical protein
VLANDVSDAQGGPVHGVDRIDCHRVVRDQDGLDPRQREEIAGERRLAGVFRAGEERRFVGEERAVHDELAPVARVGGLARDADFVHGDTSIDLAGENS